MNKLIILLFISSPCLSQSKDTLTAKQDSIATVKVIEEIYSFMESKNVGVKDYIMVQRIIESYRNEKFIKPKH